MRPIPTSAELLERFRVAADSAIRTRLGPGARLSWAPTSLLNVFRVASVRLGERVLFLVQDRFQASFLETARGADLDAWAASEAPGFPRQPVTSSTARLTLTRASTILAGVIPAGSRFGTTPTPSTPQVSFRSIADVPVAAGVASVAVDVECEATGESGNVLATTINRSLGALFDTFGTVTNAAAAAGGGPAETDEQFRARLRQRDARYRRGTTQAVMLGALGVPGVRRVTIFDPMNSDVADGNVVVVVGDANGVGSDPMADAVRAELVNWVAAGVSAAVEPASRRNILAAPELPPGTTQVRVEITYRKDPTFDRVAVESAARKALAALFAGLQSSQPLYTDQWKTAVMDVDRRIRRVRFFALPSGAGFSDLVGPSARNERWAADDAVWLFQGWTEVP